MINDYYNEIVSKSVLYYENNFMSPEFQEQATINSVIDCSGYFYAYALKLIQNFFKKKKDEAGESILQLITKQKASLTVDLQTILLSDFNQIYLSLVDSFKNGLDLGEESLEGFKLMLDASTKIVAISIYWLENGKKQ